MILIGALVIVLALQYNWTINWLVAVLYFATIGIGLWTTKKVNR